MSGKQAKAKRKGAKKTAVKKPPMDGARLDEFILRDVRCFAGEHRVPIRPVTLLVGENSTGKTTFLGCYQKFVDMFSPVVQASTRAFTRPPFKLGGFPNIVRRSANGKSGPDEFQVGGVVVGGAEAETPVTVRYFFHDNHGEARVARMVMEFPDGDELTAAEKEFEKSGMPPDQQFMEFSGPGFCRIAAFPAGLMTELTVGAFVRLFALLPEVPREMIPKTLRAVLPKDSEEERKKNRKRMWDFMARQFHFQSGEDAKIEFVTRASRALLAVGECVAVAPLRPFPRRIYDPRINNDPEELLFFEMSRVSHDDPEKWAAFHRRLTEFGAKSDMFSDLKMESYGEEADAPFSMRVNARGVDDNIADVGFGVSQLLPFLGRVAKASLEGGRRHFLFQQPEDHLHPLAQAEFVSFIADAARREGHAFLVETHSDYIIDRLRICVSNGVIPPEDVVILYFDPRAPGDVKIHPIRMDEVANLLGAPKNYRRFFVDEDDRLLGFKKLPKGRAHVRHR